MKNIKLEELVFVSDTELLDGKINPRIPNNFFTKNGYEDNKTKRICFSTSIDKCLMGLSKNLTDTYLFVYKIDLEKSNITEKDIYKPSIKQVPDANITDEVWILKSIYIKHEGKIHVIKDDGKKKVKNLNMEKI